MPWAKLSETGCLSVVEHGADVAAVFETIIRGTFFGDRLSAAAGREISESVFEKGDSLGGVCVIHGVSTAIKPGPTSCLPAVPTRRI